MQVLQHEQHRGGGRELGEQAEHAAEHLLPGQARMVLVGLLPVAALGEQPAQAGPGAERVAHPGRLGRAPERVGQRQVGHAVAQLGALAGQHGEATAGGERRDLADQAGLADPRVAADQGDDRAAGFGVVEQRQQAAELIVPADHAPRRHPQHHVHEYPIRQRQFRFVKPRLYAAGMEKVTKTDAEWREVLTPEEYAVLRRAGTEAPFTGEYTDTKTEGVYRCRACGAELFRSDAKFESHCGWPSFYQPTETDAVVLIEDRSLGTTRTEVRCARCDSHLGHVFTGEGYDVPTDERWCINSVSLTLEPVAAS